MPIFYIFSGLLYLRYVFYLYSRNLIIQTYLSLLALPTLIIAPFTVLTLKVIFLTTTYEGEIFDAFESIGFHFNWLIAIFSFLFFLRFIPNLWIFNNNNKINRINNAFLKVHFPFRTAMIIFGIGFLLSFSNFIVQYLTSENQFLFDRDAITREAEQKLLDYGRGIFGLIQEIATYSRYILISHIINIQKIKKVYNPSNFKILCLTYLGSAIFLFFVQLLTTSSRLGMIIQLILIFLQYKYIFAELPISFNRIKFKLINIFYFFVFCTLPPLFSFLSLFRQGREGGSFNLIQNSLHGLSGFFTMTEFAVLYSLLKNLEIDFEYGYSFLLDIIQFVPRFLWTNKPITSFSYRLSQEVYNLSPENPSTWVHTFTPWGEGYMQFSTIGVIIASLLLILIASLAVGFVNRYQIFTFNFLFLFLPTYITTFRGDLSAAFGRFYDFFLFSLIGYLFLVILLKIIPLSKTKII